jgi:hypothetical protein
MINDFWYRLLNILMIGEFVMILILGIYKKIIQVLCWYCVLLKVDYAFLEGVKHNS